jgi:hypothetical protein
MGFIEQLENVITINRLTVLYILRWLEHMLESFLPAVSSPIFW